MNNKKYEFKFLTPVKNKPPRPKIEARGSFLKNGIILNVLATKYLNNATHAALGYDPQHQAIAIMPIAENDQQAIKISYSKQDNTARIGIATIVFHHPDAPFARRRPVIWDNELEAIIIPLVD